MLFKFVANRTAARLKQAPIAFGRVTWACSKRAPARHSRIDNQLQLFAVAGARIQGLCPCSRQKNIPCYCRTSTRCGAEAASKQTSPRQKFGASIPCSLPFASAWNSVQSKWHGSLGICVPSSGTKTLPEEVEVAGYAIADVIAKCGIPMMVPLTDLRPEETASVSSSDADIEPPYYGEDSESSLTHTYHGVLPLVNQEDNYSLNPSSGAQKLRPKLH